MCKEKKRDASLCVLFPLCLATCPKNVLKRLISKFGKLSRPSPFSYCSRKFSNFHLLFDSHHPKFSRRHGIALLKKPISKFGTSSLPPFPIVLVSYIFLPSWPHPLYPKNSVENLTSQKTHLEVWYGFSAFSLPLSFLWSLIFLPVS